MGLPLRRSGLHAWSFLAPFCVNTRHGGASRDRTGDLKLAKLALSQLSYGPPQLMRMFTNVRTDERAVADGGPRRS